MNPPDLRQRDPGQPGPALSARLEVLRERHAQSLLQSIDFLKELLSLAHDLVAAENDMRAEEDDDRGKAALTELFQQVRTESTPMMVERVVTDIDEIVRLVRFPGWQPTSAGEREVRSALRKSHLKSSQNQDQELFEKASGYVKQLY